MSGPLAIARIQPTQAGVRDPWRMHRLAGAVAAGYDFVKERAPVQLSRFEDGQIYCHNGHHRIGSCTLAGREMLLEGEYRIEEWTYAQYQEINWAARWTTPFDPRLETRIADLTPFRVALGFVVDRAGEPAAEAFIRRHTGLYRTPRVVTTFVELIALCFDAEQWASAQAAAQDTLRILTDKGEDR